MTIEESSKESFVKKTGRPGGRPVFLVEISGILRASPSVTLRIFAAAPLYRFAAPLLRKEILVFERRFSPKPISIKKTGRPGGRPVFLVEISGIEPLTS